MINSTYEASNLFPNCDNNNVYTEKCLSHEVTWPKCSSTCLITKSRSFKETRILNKEGSLIESENNAIESPTLIDCTDEVNVLNQQCSSSSTPSSLCDDSSSSESFDCGLPTGFNYDVFRKQSGAWPFCPVDVCVRCQDSALTLNNRGACLCTDAEKSCPHEALCSSNKWSTCDNGNCGPSTILHEGYSVFEIPNENLKMVTKSQQLDDSARNNSDEAGIKYNIDDDDDDYDSPSSTSTSSSTSSSSSSSSFFFSSPSSSSSSESSCTSTSRSSSSSPTFPRKPILSLTESMKLFQRC